MNEIITDVDLDAEFSERFSKKFWHKVDGKFAKLLTTVERNGEYYVPICCTIRKQDIEGLYVNVGNRKVRMDRYGEKLWKEHRWIISYKNFFLHRFDREGKLIAFHREMFHFDNTNEKISFINGDKLDCRLVNLECSLLIKHYHEDCWDLLTD